jgi:hypothetical protein
MLQTLKTRLVECEHPVGQKKTTNCNLPSSDFTYGKPPQFDKEGVGISKNYNNIVTRSWNVHQPTNTKTPPQDFVRINKLAVSLNASNHFVRLKYLY